MRSFRGQRRTVTEPPAAFKLRNIGRANLEDNKTHGSGALLDANRIGEFRAARNEHRSEQARSVRWIDTFHGRVAVGVTGGLLVAAVLWFFGVRH